ncbi:hypothetical protein glysoja_039058 [Glycine soja]|uniref:Sieve element occlusion N-terminal domain-containing protein n=1 Tax=Glycine soja TaxID=3848 RepID=A0A0B2Q1C9_GLYSO|nr:hypothetical protein glysoja_039058 [Glycine soja]
MSNSNTQPKPLLPNPFNLSDTEIVEKVYVLSHTYDDQVFDNEPLFNVVSNVIKLSTQIVGALHKIDEPNGFIGNPISTTSFKPEFSTLKLMSCQMMTLPWGPENAHQTTLGILQQLRDYSWDAKVLIAIAALALEYGNFWNLQQVSEPQGNSLRLLNQIQHRQILVTNINTTVKLVMNVEVFKEKYVLLLFISGLVRIEDEIRLLNSIYERLVEDPNDKSGFKKEEFKILWIPIENKWGDARRELFNTLKSDIKWYVVVESRNKCAQVPLPSIRLMEEDLKFQGKPILLVVKPQGTMLNDDALDIIFEWGSTHSLSGNPKLTYLLRNGNAYLLAQKWKWFWHEAKKTNLHGIQAKWKERVLLKEGFDIAFQEYYDTQRDLPAPQPCEFNTLDVLATITCPNASCGRVMEVTSVNYKCCHGGNVADHAFKSRSTTAILPAT